MFIAKNEENTIAEVIKEIPRKINNHKVKVLVIPTDEELMIANLTYKKVSAKNKIIGQFSKIVFFIQTYLIFERILFAIFSEDKPAFSIK